MISISDGLLRQPKRKIFVSYHHAGDQSYYDSFTRHFCETLDVITDNSLERRIDSADVSYVMRRIREHHLAGSSCTIVLCGRETPKRKYVDWEIEASLQQQMGVIGVMLPTIIWQGEGTEKPPRLQDNIDSGYAKWVDWKAIVANPSSLTAVIESANMTSSSLIRNGRSRMLRNA